MKKYWFWMGAAMLSAQIFLSLSDGPSEGEQLARQYCGSCHLYTPPSDFTKKEWEDQILPRMALFMGLYPNDSVKNALAGQPYIFPDQPLLSADKLDKIKAFYLKKAPKQRPAQQETKMIDTLPCFLTEQSDSKIIPPGVSLARFDQGGKIAIGDAYAQKLFFFNSQNQLLNSGRIGEGVVDMYRDSHLLWLTVMGSFSPTDVPSGYLLKIDTETGLGTQAAERLFRPVSAAFGDLDGKPGKEVVISEFGRYKGQLAWYEQLKDNLVPHLLMERPGAIKSILSDLDQDGDLDITALFGQADEGIWQFINDGKGQFEVKNILRFSPAYGSSSIDFCDFNKDGLQDIVYTSGDNADFNLSVKPWNGIYIFTNQGNFKYRQSLFLPMPGAYQAKMTDFDLDGDLDIAAIAFFPDFNKARVESFVFFQNNGQNQFERFTFPKASDGRWMTMDTGDPDNDGDIDIILGSMTFEVSGKPEWAQQWKQAGIPYVILRNTTQR